MNECQGTLLLWAAGGAYVSWCLAIATFAALRYWRALPEEEREEGEVPAFFLWLALLIFWPALFQRGRRWLRKETSS